MSRVKRSAAAMAEAKIREVLDWEELSEHSAKFKAYAARIDEEFAAEQKSKRVKERDLDTMEDAGNDSEEECDDEVPTAEDLAFIEADEAYQSTDEDFHTAGEDGSELESEDESELGSEGDSELGSEGDSELEGEGKSELGSKGLSDENKPDVIPKKEHNACT